MPVQVVDGDGDTTNANLALTLVPDETITAQWQIHSYDLSGGTFGATPIAPNIIGSDFGDTISGSTGMNLLYGGSGNDILNGAAGDDQLNGGAGNDTLDGGLGADILLGGDGNDQLTGGSSSDLFRYKSLTDGGDTITDFDISAPIAGGDVLDVSAVLNLTGNTYVDGSSVSTAQSGGFLIFENDGTNHVRVKVDIDAGGATAPVTVAVLQNVTWVSVADAITKLSDNIKLD